MSVEIIGAGANMSACNFSCVLLVQGKRGKPPLVPGPINGLHPDHTHQALLALDILNWMTVSRPLRASVYRMVPD